MADAVTNGLQEYEYQMVSGGSVQYPKIVESIINLVNGLQQSKQEEQGSTEQAEKVQTGDLGPVYRHESPKQILTDSERSRVKLRGMLFNNKKLKIKKLIYRLPLRTRIQ